jgi:thiol-disulfide isomerase/thioredoxin
VAFFCASCKTFLPPLSQLGKNFERYCGAGKS